jgi:sterol desaturase/sphingolipid hydroxylase (fatty acid hydroxylase superfamily)
MHFSAAECALQPLVAMSRCLVYRLKQLKVALHPHRLAHMIEDTLFWTDLVKAFLGQALTYFFIVSALFLIFWKWGEQRLLSYRIQKRDRVNARQISFEVRHSLIALLMGALTATLITLLYSSGQTRLTTDADSIGWLWIVVTTIGLLAFNDAWFYFWHRLFHHPKLFRYVHAVHHKSVDVNPFSSYSFHWVEGAILGAWVVPVVMFVPIYLPSLAFLQVIGMANNLMSHLGYELLPASLLRVPLLRWMNTSTFHNLHHTSLKGNYGLMTRMWDRLLDTEIEHYEATFCARAVSNEQQAK